mgnify:CR=1 FL=1
MNEKLENISEDSSTSYGTTPQLLPTESVVREVSKAVVEDMALQSKLAVLDERVSGVTQDLKSTKENRKWIIGLIVGLISIIIAFSGVIYTGVSIYINLIKDSQDSYRNLQKDYYEELIRNKDQIYNFIIKTEIKNGCLQKDLYWEYKNCVLQLEK